MPEAARPAAWTWDQYLDWESRQPIRHELIDGQLYAMTGGTAAHDTIGNNLRFLLRTHLHGNPCRPQGPDFKIKAGPNGRYPDAFIDRGPFDPNALVAAEPVAVFEVPSKTTEWFDLALKLRDYDAVPSIRFYAVISQDKPRIIVYTRDENHRAGAADHSSGGRPGCGDRTAGLQHHPARVGPIRRPRIRTRCRRTNNTLRALRTSASRVLNQTKKHPPQPSPPDQNQA